MISSRQMLSSVLKTAQLGQVGIRSVLDTSMRPGLRSALESQLLEFDTIEGEAHLIASQRGWELPELDPVVRFLTDATTRMKLGCGNTDSGIADLLIRDNTRKMIRLMQDLHQFREEDQRVAILSQKLLDCENAGIMKMQPFL